MNLNEITAERIRMLCDFVQEKLGGKHVGFVLFFGVEGSDNVAVATNRPNQWMPMVKAVIEQDPVAMMDLEPTRKSNEPNTREVD